MSKISPTLFLGILLCTACSKKIVTFLDKKNELRIINPSFKYLTSGAKLKLDHNNRKISASANFRMHKDSLIWVSVSPGLGIEIFRVLINREQVFAMDKLNKKYYEYTFDDLTKKYGFALDFDLVQSLILGNLTTPYTDEKLEKKPSHVSFSIRKGIYTFENFIGTTSGKLEKIKVSDDTSKNTILVNYSDFIAVNDEIFPHEITTVIDYESEKKSKTAIDISYNKFSIEKKSPSFPFSVPARYGRKIR